MNYPADNIMDMGKVPPHSIAAEQSVLGAAMSSDVALSEVMALLRSEDFYSPDHRLIFEAIVDLYMVSKPIDIITVSDALDSKSMLERAGGLAYISKLPDLVPFMSNASQYAETVRQKAILRKLIESLDEINKLCFEDGRDANELLGIAAKRIYDIRENRDSDGFESLKDILIRTIEGINEIKQKNTNERLVKTGFLNLDRKLGGIPKGSLVILAARPAMGKTALALNMAQRIATIYDIPAAIFSLEMSKEEVASRILSSQSFVNSRDLKTGDIIDEDWEKISKALPALSNSKIYVDDRSGTNVVEMMSKCRQLKLENKLGVVIIDYLQLMSSANRRSDSRQQEISEISRSLKIMAKELSVPVIALSQLSRASEMRPDKRPILSDLRDSGAIEQDADIVLFLYRESYHKEEELPGETENAELIVAKNRHGETGKIFLTWWPRYVTFMDPKKSSDPEPTD